MCVKVDVTSNLSITATTVLFADRFIDNLFLNIQDFQAFEV